MAIFSKAHLSAGWLATAFQGDGVSAVQVSRPPATQPVVEWLAFYPAEPAASAAQLERLCREARAERCHCTTMLADGEYQIMTVDAPNVPPEELKTAIRWRLKDMLDYHIDDATIDVIDIPADKNAPTRNRSMFAIAARNQVVQQKQEAFAKAKIPLSVIDVPEMAQRNIAALLEPEGRGLALLSFDDDGALLTLTHGGELYVSRRIDMPLAQLVRGDEASRNEACDRITLELQRSLDHFDRQFHFITLAKLVLGPIGEGGTGLQRYLADNLHLQVELLDVGSIFDISRTPSLRDIVSQQRFFLTLGAALRHEEKVL
ncbi:MAG: agglutinin biogenesis protein MshI [Proteobacteria bacterium]|nr:agglutinin biogenesis protein MshI [Pseudomonadota bacterium]